MYFTISHILPDHILMMINLSMWHFDIVPQWTCRSVPIELGGGVELWWWTYAALGGFRPSKTASLGRHGLRWSVSGWHHRWCRCRWLWLWLWWWWRWCWLIYKQFLLQIFHVRLKFGSDLWDFFTLCLPHYDFLVDTLHLHKDKVTSMLTPFTCIKTKWLPC